MGSNRRLFFAWSIFLVAALSFIMTVEMYHNSRKERSSNFQYRILIDKSSIIENEEKNSDATKLEDKKINKESELYERTKYGYLPKISKDGICVFDEYSAHSGAGSKKELRIAVLVDDINKVETAVKLNNQKITFIVPHYIDNFESVIKIIRENGHEFFLQMPTQSSIPANKKEIVSPFLANADVSTTLDKLFYLLASTKYAIGIANISTTLLTKSKKDMTAIADSLAQRGLAFFDFENTNDFLQNIAEKSSLFYVQAAKVFEVEEVDISKLQNGDVLMIRLTCFENFVKKLTSDWLLAPISAAIRKQP
ncbi:MAG: divergent polysaccharide deacetylase family protein [Holosporaceae bacterium]|jgi:polysaccharide deacetylase 2 family uncharacterized protein YibQ|nr:divergent polysaccharide deacetylase family protein [Holosporaceae bacterium]